MSVPLNQKKELGCLAKSVVFIFLVVLGVVSIGPMTGSIRKARQLECMGNAMFIAERLDDYARDHDGHYPTGKTSAEIFQTLIDEGYINDPYQFCWDGWLTNRTTAHYSGRLKSEDICYDVTVPMDSTGPAHLPLVYLTGYKVDYSPGGAASPLPIVTEAAIRRFMVVTYRDGTMAFIPGYHWSAFGRGDYYLPGPPYDLGGKTPKLWPGDNYVSPSSNHASYSFADPQTGFLGGRLLSDGTIANFIPADFDAKGRVYRQLTPVGEIPP